MKTNARGVDLIKGFEKLCLSKYLDAVGKPTIGYGHLIVEGESYTTITEAQADDLLRKDLEIAEQAVTKGVTTAINENQFAALVAICFNIGATNFLSSSLLEKVNARDFLYAPEQFARWNKGKDPKTKQRVVLKGLITRRAAEAELFVTKI